ncbi:hypothetical protein BDY24DRAFT_414689 [Mrakia frigida]|uniref:uncharacterized protein n=1 Tax=Mrakia frigida TaxID=29902 RepID=UPI003FCBF689
MSSSFDNTPSSFASSSSSHLFTFINPRSPYSSIPSRAPARNKRVIPRPSSSSATDCWRGVERRALPSRLDLYSSPRSSPDNDNNNDPSSSPSSSLHVDDDLAASSLFEQEESSLETVGVGIFVGSYLDLNPGVAPMKYELSVHGYESACQTPEVGARNIVYGCLTQTSQVAYIASCKEEEPGDFVISSKGRKMGAMIWEERKAIWMKEGVLA